MRSTVPSGRDADGSDDGKVVKEMERLALVSSESLDDLRHRLLVYRAGDLWFPAGGIPKQETDIPLVITVLLLGFAGSGKSSLVNLMYSVLGRAGIVPFAHTSSPADKNRHRILTFKTMVVRCFTASNDMDHCSPNFKIDASDSFRFPFKSHAMEAYSSHMLLIKSSKCCKGVFCSESVAERLHVEKGFVLEDATGLALHGDIDIQSIFAASLPTSHSSFSQHESLEFFPKWKASPLPNGSVDLFIGIISTGSHFAERMAVRKSWMSFLRKSSKMVARFFVALHGRNEVNIELKKEAEFFGDIVIVPFMDSYDLVVLKTVAICEYGVRTVSAKYIMKCDDDTFVRIGLVIKILKNVTRDKSLYMGNMNYDHKPLRSGKWAVTYEEWPEEVYPPYANGPGYIISSDIARFVVSGFENHTLDMFKMEDVSMGLWVQQFGRSAVVEYLHSHRFCQFGCINGYFTAHYQSPRQMMCLWDKLKDGIPQCCNMR